MSQARREQYLKALDVPAFLYANPGIKNLSVEKISTQCLVIETASNNSFCENGKSQDFLLKMLSSIGLKQADIECINIGVDDLNHTLSAYNAKTVLLMSEGLTPSSIEHFVAHHPSEILTNDKLKREAWEVLKQVQQCLK